MLEWTKSVWKPVVYLDLFVWPLVFGFCFLYKEMPLVFSLMIPNLVISGLNVALASVYLFIGGRYLKSADKYFKTTDKYLKN